jgi:hypothetical protein
MNAHLDTLFTGIGISVIPLDDADEEGVIPAMTPAGPMRIQVLDEDTVVTKDYWVCHCGRVQSRRWSQVCHTCSCTAENADDALLEEVIAQRTRC